VRIYRKRKRVWIGPLENDRFWWKDPVKKIKHSELTRAGLERARQAGKRVTTLKVEEREGFAEKFVPVLEQLEKMSINRRQAAKKLGISGPTLKRVLDNRLAATRQAPAGDKERNALVAEGV
jgi:hypothetical protein